MVDRGGTKIWVQACEVTAATRDKTTFAKYFKETAHSAVLGVEE